MSHSKQQVRRSFAAAAQRYDSQAELQRQVALRLLADAPLTASYPTLLDLGCGTGFFTAQLRQRTAIERLVALDIAQPMLAVAREKLGSSRIDYVCADAEHLPLATGCIDAICSNLALQWCPDLAGVFRECRRVLQPNGLLLFSSFAPQTLHELKTAWATVDAYSHVNDFQSQAQTQALLQQAGFNRIQAHSQLYQLRYSSVFALMHELKAIGAHHVSDSRNKAPTSRRRLQQMLNAYPQTADGDIIASYEVLFIHAYC